MYFLTIPYQQLIVVFMLLASTSIVHADIFMQKDTDEEIYLSNLIDNASTDKPAVMTLKASHQHRHIETLTHTNSAYILLVQDDVTSPPNKKIMANGLAIATAVKNYPYAESVAIAASQTAMDPALLHAVIRVESNYNTKALSTRGARGLMQLMPATAKRFKVNDPEDAAQNILAGAKYLRELQMMFKGDIRLALAAYNAGPNAVIKYGSRIPPINETRLYVPRVLEIYEKIAAKNHQ